jgi:hypothetical protein
MGVSPKNHDIPPLVTEFPRPDEARGTRVFDPSSVDRLYDGCPITYWLFMLIAGRDEDRLAAARGLRQIWAGIEVSGRASISWPVISIAEAELARSRVLKGYVSARAALMMPYLLLGLDDPLVEVRESCLSTIRDMGPQAFCASRRLHVAARRDASAEVRREAALALMSVSGDSDYALATLVALLDEADAALVERVVEDIVALGGRGKRALRELRMLLDRVEGDLRKVVQRAIEELERL